MGAGLWGWRQQWGQGRTANQGVPSYWNYSYSYWCQQLPAEVPATNRAYHHYPHLAQRVAQVARRGWAGERGAAHYEAKGANVPCLAIEVGRIETEEDANPGHERTDSGTDQQPTGTGQRHIIIEPLGSYP